MRITFLGGTETVTGSKYLVETDTTRVLVDCGLFQGYKWLRRRNWEPLPLDIDRVDAVVLTHAHLDHSGYLPVLYKQGYRGPVYAHHATFDLCRILLTDSGHIQEEDAKFYSRHHLSKHRSPEPLYDRDTAEASLELFRGIAFNETVKVGDICFYLQPAGHILGAASVILSAEGKTIGFSGDVGRHDDLLMKAPTPLPELDLLLLESTYGNRDHDAVDVFEQLASIVCDTAKSGGVLMIPSFSVGRAQLLLHMLTVLKSEGRIPNMPVYLDSPMAIDVSEIYCRYAEEHRLNNQQCQAMSAMPMMTRYVDESKAIAEQRFPHIIIAGSGMATGGRILHHMKRHLRDSKSTILFTGFQAGGTRGAKMAAGVESVKIHGQWIPVNARVEMLKGYSGHADRGGISQWLGQSKLKKDTEIYLVHGEPEALEGLREHLNRHNWSNVNVGMYHEIKRLK